MKDYEQIMKSNACEGCRRMTCSERSEDVAYCSDRKIIITRKAKA